MFLVDSLRRLLRCTSGSALLEGTLAVPIAISLMAGGVEFGQLFTVYGTAAKSMRNATRYLARVPDRDAGGNLTTADICGWGLTNAKNLAVYGKTNPTVGDQPLINGWTRSMVSLDQPSCSGSPPDPLIIQLSANVPYIGIMFGAIGLSNVWTLNVKHQERSIGE